MIYESAFSWKRLALKTTGLLLCFNLAFLITQPFEFISKHISLYNWFIPGRERLPYGDRPQLSLNVSVTQITAMLASHRITAPKADDEYRIVLLGDSSVWGWRLSVEEMLSTQLNALNLQTGQGQHLRFYNLGYPQLSGSKDILLLDAVRHHDVDAFIWFTTLQSLIPEDRYTGAFFQSNRTRLDALIAQSHLLEPRIPAEPLSLYERSLMGQRDEIARWMRLQSYGIAWAASGRDQWIPEAFTPVSQDPGTDLSWLDYAQPSLLKDDDIQTDMIHSAITLSASRPLLIINQPILISDGLGSEMRYNSLYPRWAYDQYLTRMQDNADSKGWHYLNLWDAMPPESFTDSPVHLNAEATALLARLMQPALLELIQSEGDTVTDG